MLGKDKKVTSWAIKWRSDNRLDGKRENFIFQPHNTPLIFKSRDDARTHIRANFGYISKRRDLRIEPHGWLVPIPVKVRVIVEEVE